MPVEHTLHIVVGLMEIPVLREILAVVLVVLLPISIAISWYKLLLARSSERQASSSLRRVRRAGTPTGEEQAPGGKVDGGKTQDVMNGNYKGLQKSELSLEDAKREYLPKAVPCLRCKTPVSELRWLYKGKPKDGPGRAGWITVCDHCKQSVDFFIERQQYYAWEEVNACRNDKRLQSEHALEDAKREYLPRAVLCPKCKTPASQLPWFYFDSSLHTPRTAGWMTVCDQCDLQVDFFVEKQEYFFWEKVNAFRNDRSLQSHHPPEGAKSKHLKKARSCPRCNTPAEQLSWLYLVNPERDSESLRISWMTVCDKCNIQIDFFEEFSLRQYSWERVNASRNDKNLQYQHPSKEAKNEYLKDAMPCPICNTPAEQLPWFYFVHPEYSVFPGWPPTHVVIGWMTVCDQCNIQINFFEEFSRYQYSWEQVNVCRNDKSFQSQYPLCSLEEARSRYLKKAVSCPVCNTPAEQLSWFYFTTPEQDWKALAGRAGWMTVCDNCNIQVNRFVELLS